MDLIGNLNVRHWKNDGFRYLRSCHRLVKLL